MQDTTTVGIYFLSPVYHLLEPVVQDFGKPKNH